MENAGERRKWERKWEIVSYNVDRAILLKQIIVNSSLLFGKFIDCFGSADTVYKEIEKNALKAESRIENKCIAPILLRQQDTTYFTKYLTCFRLTSP